MGLNLGGGVARRPAFDSANGAGVRRIGTSMGKDAFKRHLGEGRMVEVSVERVDLSATALLSL